MRVRETFPDAVLGAADEVVLIDLTPEALIERLRAGKIYPPERVDAALNNFFRIENLAALREVALRQVAEDVEAKRLVARGAARHPRGARDRRRRRRRSASGCSRWSARSPSSQRLVRRAWRSAQRLGAELDLLWVTPPAPAGAGEEREQLEALRRLGSVLGAHLLVEEGDDVVATVAARVAARARHHLRPDGRAAAAHAACGRLRRAAARAADAPRCPGSTCGSSPTARKREDGDEEPRVARDRGRVSGGA